MSFWIHAFCNESVASVQPQELKSAISKRLSLLTSLFCPENEEDPEIVLERLRIENIPESSDFQSFLIHYGPVGSTFIRADRNDRSGVDELVADILPSIADAGVRKIEPMLRTVIDDVSFCLKVDDVQGMGFPLAIAAAAYLVERAGGLIQSGTYSWMEPYGNEVRMLHEIDG